ncbi:hypothetical protein F4821DRAFT_219670 [Hypoxylon rubiginosum]|uniref:Uncharacterized protein n=1 Tax=Hypoxylon rubiginosum TaxID=110542 RepID=A0ACC0CP18_9PEZI|nr:hypothetical protein F4821DRAFT_219670 [Hypoxylon rubiginosum]
MAATLHDKSRYLIDKVVVLFKMKFHSLLFGPILLAGSGLAGKGDSPRGITTISLPAAPPPLPTGEPPSSSTASAPVSSGPGGSGGSGGSGPKCGKGYTYCGYMLTSDGHNFAPNDVSKAYCNGLSELCANGKPKTDVQEAVFVCMNDQPSNVELLCACSGKCRNDAESNFIAHCDKPCING